MPPAVSKPAAMTTATTTTRPAAPVAAGTPMQSGTTTISIQDNGFVRQSFMQQDKFDWDNESDHNKGGVEDHSLYYVM